MKVTTATSTLSPGSDKAEGTKLYSQYFLFICLAYLVVACLLAVRVQWGVMDEDFHLDSSLPFARSGVNTNTLYNHVPPTGVSSHIWFAFWIWLFPNIDYIGLRLITCGFLFVLVGWIYSHLKHRSVDTQKRVLGASLFMLAFPYFFLSTSTVMTEGPSLIFLFAGLLLLSIASLQQFVPFFLGCLLLGITTISRFYYIPLLPALAVALFLSDWRSFVQQGLRSITTHKVMLYLAIAVSLLPLVGLIILWGGLTPPAFHQWSKLRSGVSFNAFRPLTALAMLGVYTAPAVLVNVPWTSTKMLYKVLASMALAVVLAIFQVNLFHDSSSVDDVYSGPVEHVLIWLTARGNLMFSLGLFVIYAFGILNLILLGNRFMDYVRLGDFSDSGLVLSLGVVIFFVASQAFVGGNHPFYDRYLGHPWPFMGYVIVTFFPRFLNPKTYLVLAAYTVFSVMILAKWGIH